MYLETEGKNLEIGVNPKYFLDALKAIDDEEVFIEFGSKHFSMYNKTNRKL